jgi:FkbM family methyltransferase
LLEPKKVVDYKKIRVGNEGDGGYVQIDDLEGISHALAFGVSGNDSWDLAMAKAGIPVEQFDHAIERAPSSHPLLHFHRKMISVDATAETATLSDLVVEHSKLGAPDLILKIDIEGCEWEVFDRATDAVLSRLAQVVCEFHDLSHLTAPAFRARARRVFEKLDKHFGRCMSTATIAVD